MMATMELEDAIGAQWRLAQGRKADRAATLLYTATPRRNGGSGPKWSVAQRWILDGGTPSGPRRYFIGETVRESVETADAPPSARAGLIRVAGLAYVHIPGPVVVERSRFTGPDALAVLGGYLEMRGREMVTWLPGARNRPFLVTHRHLRDWIKDAGVSPATVDRWVQELLAAAKDEFTALFMDSDGDALTHLGQGRLRELDLAREAAEARREAGWNDAHIREYLRLYGFTNASGTVGVWSHAQYMRLLAGSR